MMSAKPKRDIEKGYTNAEFAAKLRRLADALETGEKFEIQIAGERVYVPVRAEYTVEHERCDDEEEIEFQIKWSPKQPLTAVLIFAKKVVEMVPVDIVDSLVAAKD